MDKADIAIRHLKQIGIAYASDPETAHEMADSELIKFVENIGLRSVTDAYREEVVKQCRWWAYG